MDRDMVRPSPMSKSAAPSAAAERSEAAILAAARALFLEAGYDGANLDQVARRAGVARQTVYNRFGSKEAMFRAMVEDHWRRFNRAEALDDLGSNVRAGDLRAALDRIARALLAFLDGSDQIAFTRLVIAESRRLPWVAEAFHRLGKGPAVESFAEKLGLLQAAGVIACPDTRLAARQFIGLIQEFVLWPQVMATGEAQAPDREKVVAEAIEMFVARYGVGAAC
jgi:TetR/AcrR family transcriptional regulator of autoinduction and epiphytic fitness